MEVDSSGIKEDLWGGDGSMDHVEFVLSSEDDDEVESALNIRHPLARSTLPPVSRVSTRGTSASATPANLDQEEEEEVDELQDELQEDDEAEEAADILMPHRSSSSRGSELPGAFPHDPVTQDSSSFEEPPKRSSRRSTSKKPAEMREVLSGWVGPEPTSAPPSKPTSRGSSKPVSSSKLAVPAPTKARASSAPRRSTRASSVLSDAVTEDGQHSDEENNRSSKSLRRSSRLSATPGPQSQDDHPPKSKKIRASVSPSRESSISGSTSSKTSKKKRGSSVGAPAAPSSRASKRRPAVILEEVEE